MDTSNFKEMFTTDEVKQLRQRVAELEGERDAALAETKAMSDQHMEISRECITLKSALGEEK